MIEIKVRGWDTAKKIMYSAEEMGADQLTLSPDGRGFVNVHGDDTKRSKFYPHITPLLFTGLPDKNGNESYMDDIVKYKDDSGTPQVGVIKDRGYLNCYFEAIGGDDEGNQDGELHPDIPFEIIGNIHANPELSKGKEDK